MKTFRFDTETYPIRPGLLSPRLVCLQSALDDDVVGLNGPVTIDLTSVAAERLEAALDDPTTLLEAHNGSFDHVVTSGQYPHLTAKWFRALGNGRGRDTMLREQLLEIRNGTFQDNHPKGHWSLGGIAKRRCGLDLDKSADSWRLRYALLDGVPTSDWPADALQYATEDITALREVSRAQYKNGTPADEWLQVAAAFCLQLSATWGLRSSEFAIGWSEMCALSEDEFCINMLTEAGMFSDGSVKKDAVQKAVERACAAMRKPVPKTPPSTKFPQGQTKTDADTCESLAEADSALTMLSRHNTASKMASTYLDPLKPGTKYAMTSRPNVLVGTGRTSWSGARLNQTNPWWPTLPEGQSYETVEERAGTNLQNWPQMSGIRECVVPRDGYYFASVDYSSLELRTLGQACLWLLGESTFAKGYQDDVDWDPHSYFGGSLIGIDYEEALRRKKTDPRFKNGPRKIGKALNFSLPGGVGARRFAEMSEALYKAKELPEPISIEQAYGYKAAWLEAYPEMKRYFEYVAWLAETGTPLTQLVSNRVRGGGNFTSIANSFFQGLAADLAKRALFYVSRACYCDPDSPLFGCRVLAFIHDELFMEVLQVQAHEACMEVVRLMNLAFTEICPDVPSAAEPALMAKAWTKAAEPKWVNGRLVPFDL